MENIRGRVARGAIWMVAFRMVDRLLGLASTLVLARVLVPHDFGVVAMAMSVVALLELATAFGFDVALINRQSQDRDEWDTAWTFGVLFGLAVALVLVAAASPIAAFFRTTELELVIRILALGSVIQGFQNIGVVSFRKEMQFDREFYFMASRKIVSVMVTIPLAIALDSYWALVIGQIAGRLTGTLASYRFHPYRPRITLAASSKLLHYSRWLLASNLTGYVRERSSDWLLGRVSGAHSLGIFNLGAEISSLPSTELLAPINRALIPAYSAISQSPEKLRAEYLSVLSVVALLGMPAVVGLLSTAPLAVPVMLGSNWAEVVPLLMILSLAGITQIITGNIYPAYLALSRPDLIVRVNATSAIVVVAAMLALVPSLGAVGGAWAVVLSSWLVVPLSIYYLKKILGVHIRSILSAIWRPSVASAAMCAVVLPLSQRWSVESGGSSTLLRLVSAVSLGMVLYMVALCFLWWAGGRPEGGEKMLLRRLGPILDSARRRVAGR